MVVLIFGAISLFQGVGEGHDEEAIQMLVTSRLFYSRLDV
jgi:hypothetical protein